MFLRVVRSAVRAGKAAELMAASTSMPAAIFATTRCTASTSFASSLPSAVTSPVMALGEAAGSTSSGASKRRPAATAVPPLSTTYAVPDTTWVLLLIALLAEVVSTSTYAVSGATMGVALITGSEMVATSTTPLADDTDVAPAITAVPSAGTLDAKEYADQPAPLAMVGVPYSAVSYVNFSCQASREEAPALMRTGMEMLEPLLVGANVSPDSAPSLVSYSVGARLAAMENDEDGCTEALPGHTAEAVMTAKRCELPTSAAVPLPDTDTDGASSLAKVSRLRNASRDANCATASLYDVPSSNVAATEAAEDAPATPYSVVEG
jgi:hypothetical protein